MLKPVLLIYGLNYAVQPPSGGCVLKLCVLNCAKIERGQPPSGGCVLKQSLNLGFGGFVKQPPSGGCVLKQHMAIMPKRGKPQPPSGGCVLKHAWQDLVMVKQCSRLRAAVC